MMASAPAACARWASASVVAVANQAMPFSFNRVTNSGGNSPMIEETAVGLSSRKTSHCARKFGGTPSPAVAGTAGPQEARNARMRASAAASREGAGSGIQVLSWRGPLLFDLNSSIHARIASGSLMSAPRAPMLPALATAMERLAGQAPAMGASSIGSFNPYFAQNEWARARGAEGLGIGSLRDYCRLPLRLDVGSKHQVTFLGGR